jgi:hypothetical protein
MSDITIKEGKAAGFILVHADGGDCHGTPLRQMPYGGGRECPKCGISPDMQSTEFWAPKDVKR